MRRGVIRGLRPEFAIFDIAVPIVELKIPKKKKKKNT
jgi:hypothetical protein